MDKLENLIDTIIYEIAEDEVSPDSKKPFNFNSYKNENRFELIRDGLKKLDNIINNAINQNYTQKETQINIKKIYISEFLKGLNTIFRKENVYSNTINFINNEIESRKILNSVIGENPPAGKDLHELASKNPNSYLGGKLRKSTGKFIRKTTKPKSSPVITPKYHKCKDGVIRRLYKKGTDFFVKMKSKISGKFVYKKVKA